MIASVQCFPSPVIVSFLISSFGGVNVIVSALCCSSFLFRDASLSSRFFVYVHVDGRMEERQKIFPCAYRHRVLLLQMRSMYAAEVLAEQIV